MFYTKTTKIGKTRKKNISSFLAMLFCTLVLVSTIGISSGIRNSFAQQELQTQQPSTLSESPWSNELPTAGNNWQVLCGHGVCPQPSSGAGNMPIAASGDPQQQNDNNNPRFHDNKNTTLDLAFTKNKNLDLSHVFTSTKTVGPDRFRFVESYWTTEDTANSINVGTSTGSGAGSVSGSNPKLEVDTNEGRVTLAVILQYQGVANLAGITAALKLPTGFAATVPLTDDRNRFDIALSSFTGNIAPGQGVTLYFPIYVLPTAKVQLPVLGPLALHFLRAADRSITDMVGVSNGPHTENNMFNRMLTVTHAA
ncbi:MAG TPA: hypothetical protein VN922_14900, partial [Bacteroidia bacterium]|nr:hypothetical protein [Bacteroidia bacterium]